MGQKIRLNETQLKRIIHESIKKVLSESFLSDRLRSLANEHGGIKATSDLVDLTKLTDDDLKKYVLATRDEFERNHPSSYGREGEDRYRIIYFKDGTLLYDRMAEKRASEYPWPELSDAEKDVSAKRRKRMDDKSLDGKDEYIPLNKDYRNKMGYRF